MNSASVAVGSEVIAVSGVGVNCGEQLRITKRIRLRIVSAANRDGVFGMKVIKRNRAHPKTEAVLRQK